MSIEDFSQNVYLVNIGNYFTVKAFIISTVRRISCIMQEIFYNFLTSTKIFCIFQLLKVVTLHKLRLLLCLQLIAI